MRTYPVVIFTDAETSRVHVFQVDDISLDVKAQGAGMWTDLVLDSWIAISAENAREVTAEGYDQAFATLARAMSQEIDRLKKFARDEYKRGLTNGKRDALDQLRDMLDPDSEGEDD